MHICLRTNEETGEVMIDKFAYHGCEKDLAPALGVEIEVGGGEPRSHELKWKNKNMQIVQMDLC